MLPWYEQLIPWRTSRVRTSGTLAQLRNDLIGVRDYLTPQDFENTSKMFRREWNKVRKYIADTVRALSAQRDDALDPMQRSIFQKIINDLKSEKTRMIADKDKLQDKYMYDVLSKLIKIRRDGQYAARRRVLQKRNQFRQANFPDVIPPNQSILDRARREARTAYRARVATHVARHRTYTPQQEIQTQSFF